ncbi:hypothetical protein, partial [Streptomyces vinaceus]|uniref:hypothetical protein n=1 Tax=Streptomyces vinaceus TaxID=1960 RepID=UPI0036AA5EB2
TVMLRQQRLYSRPGRVGQLSSSHKINYETRPKSPCQDLTLYQALDLLQHLIVAWTGICPTCQQKVPWQPYGTI